MSQVQWERLRARLLYLGIGLLLGGILTGVVSNSYTVRIEELETIRKEQLAEKTQLIKSLETKYSKLEIETRKMKSHVQITEKTNADGSTEKTYDSKRSVESERKVVEHQLTIQKLNYERKMELLQWEYEKKRIEESRPSLSLNLGYSSDLSRYVYLNYTFWGPLQMGLFGTDRGMYGATIGISL